MTTGFYSVKTCGVLPQLKKVRSLLIAGASGFDELYVHLRLLEPPFQTSVKDLRYVSRMPCQQDYGK